MRTRNFILPLVLCCLVIAGSCKKIKEEIAKGLLIQLITGHNWKVTSFVDGGNNLTAYYADYEFQFFSNNTLNAIRNGVVEASGTWMGSEVTQSVTANFPTAGVPLNSLSGMWLVTNTKSKPWRVFSHRFEGTKELILNLEEK